MIPLIPNKTLSKDNFHSYLQQAHKTNQWSNWGWAVGELERRARDMLEIEDSKAIIATCSGTTALHAILWALFREHERNLRVGTQDFTFASNSIGPAQGPIVCDMTPELEINLEIFSANSFAFPFCPRSPVILFSTKNFDPTFSKATTGKPHSIASRIGIP